MSTSIRVNIRNVDRQLRQHMETAKFALSQQVLKDSNEYIPADTWELRNSSLTASKPNEGKLIWNTPYARRMYYGMNYNFSKDKNINASAEWFEKAKSVHKKDWLKIAKAKIERG